MVKKMTSTEIAMMEWEDINDIIDDLQETIEEIEKMHPSLRSFKAAIIRAIASIRAERASIEARLPGRICPGRNDTSESGDAATPPRRRRLEYMTSIANERLRDEIKSIL